jgi:hypothetical protein
MLSLINLNFNNFYTNKNDSNSYFNIDNEIESPVNVKNYVEKTLLNNVTLSSSEKYLIKNISFLKFTKNFVCFNEQFIMIFYIMGILILVYISHHLYYIINKDHDYISFIQGN